MRRLSGQGLVSSERNTEGYQIGDAGELLLTLRTALADNTVSIIACPVDYSENMKLTDKLGEFQFVPSAQQVA
jgi:hypothetical protein